MKKLVTITVTLLLSLFATLAQSATILEGRSTYPFLPIYFDYHSLTVRPDQLVRLNNNAQYLLSNPKWLIRLEGNTDERGTNEDNIELGENMASSIYDLLVELGILESQLARLSYGENLPLYTGHDELSWAGNRRVDFVTISNGHPVPVPATMMLLGTGLAGLAGISRKRRKQGTDRGNW